MAYDAFLTRMCLARALASISLIVKRASFNWGFMSFFCMVLLFCAIFLVLLEWKNILILGNFFCSEAIEGSLESFLIKVTYGRHAV